MLVVSRFSFVAADLTFCRDPSPVDVNGRGKRARIAILKASTGTRGNLSDTTEVDVRCVRS
jgi:hypothetical protein